MSIRQQTEAEMSVNEFTTECWLAAKRRDVNPQDDVIQRQAALILELAKSSPMVKAFVDQRVRTLRGKRAGAGAKLEIVQ